MVTIYSTPHCSACKMAKKFLDFKGVLYLEVTIDNDTVEKYVIGRSGSYHVPQFDIDGTWIVGFEPRQILALIENAEEDFLSDAVAYGGVPVVCTSCEG